MQVNNRDEESQYGIMLRKSTLDAMFALKVLIEK